jgi:transcriptional regulator with XRE-family HTH domain
MAKVPSQQKTRVLMMTCRFDFGKSLRLAQIKAGVSSTELASRLDITKQQVSQWRYREDAKLSLVERVCGQLSISPVQFLELSDD